MSTGRVSISRQQLDSNEDDGDTVMKSISDIYLGEKHDFETIRNDCLSKGPGVLYEDPEFAAIDSSLYFSRSAPDGIEWLRPPEIAAKHNLHAEMVSREKDNFISIQQGKLGDSSIVAAVALVSEKIELFQHVIPSGQIFHPSWYCGAFHFKFWRHGSWEEVVIDDRLPTIRGQLVFIHSLKINEFWPALLEKAYAKLLGSYEALRSGCVADVIHDFTGGLIETYNLEKDPPSTPFLTNSIFRALESQSLIGCCINIPGADGHTGAVLSNGLITGQQYNITDLREVKLVTDRSEVPLTLIRLRNPWGRLREWKGPWSEKSKEWNSVAAADRKAMALDVRDEAEFWMDFRDFQKNYDLIDLCNLAPGFASTMDETSNYRWLPHLFHGKWKRGVTAGGRPACKETHWLNPQYKLSLTHPDRDGDKNCTVIIELEQKDNRLLRHKPRDNLDIGFVVYKCLKDYRVPLPKEYFQKNSFFARCDCFTNTRLVTKRFVLETGNYIIMPSTYEADIETNFVLRVFTEMENLVDYVDDSSGLLDSVSAVFESSMKEKEEQFQRFFYNAAGEDQQITIYQFHQLLNTALKNDNRTVDLSIEVCKSLLSLVDNIQKDCRSKLTYLELLYLWNMIKCWKRTFGSFDKLGTGLVDSYELRSLVATLGYRLSAVITSRLVFHYSNEQFKINLESFIACMVRILNLYELFKSHEKNGKITCNLDEWLELSLTI